MSAVVNAGKLPFSPIWLEGVISGDFELDTLPLIFSRQADYDMYYEALVTKHPKWGRDLQKIRKTNLQARAQKAEGDSLGCLDTLLQCLHDRRAVFDDGDYQFYAALVHYLLTIVYFASMGLAAGRLNEALELFTRAHREITEFEYLLRKSDYHLLLCIQSNNMANYWFRKGKINAASQCCCRAYQLWMRASDLSNEVVSFLCPLLIARFATTLLVAHRFEDAQRIYVKFLKMFPEDGLEEDSTSLSSHATDSGEAGGPGAQGTLPVNITTMSLVQPQVPSQCCLRSLSIALTPVSPSPPPPA
eukprot:RCo039069